jgi:hypothetical protein
MIIRKEELLEYHASSPAAKISVTPTKPCHVQRDLGAQIQLASEGGRPRPEAASLGHAVLLAVLVPLLLFLLRRKVSADPYLYDEADCMYVASFGFLANSSARPLISIVGFLRAGFTRGERRGQRHAHSGIIHQG